MARPRVTGGLALGPVLVWTVLVVSSPADEPGPASAASAEFFETRVRPVLAERCQTCHGPEKQKGGLRLDSRAAVLRGGETGPAVIPGRPGESLLIEAVNYGDALQMPPKSRLTESEIAALTRWVEIGVPWPAVAGTGAAGHGSGTGSPNGFDLAARRASHWAWRPVEPGSAPRVNDAGWPRDPVDSFLLAQLEAGGLGPAPDADRRTLIRRLTFDLIGLPPPAEEVVAYLNDARPDALERVVDRLLASPRFGERWGRHWLDLVRYAESRGHEFDPTIPNAWQYRDYVVRALNADLPYDRFLTEQVAGDLLDPPRTDPVSGANESILGTGFWFLGEEVHSPVDVRQDETDRMDNRLDVMTKTFLGLTVACARCHDHKFDAISQRDYYALSGFLISSGYRQARFATAGRERQAAESLQSLLDAARRRVLSLAARASRPRIDRLADDLLAARSILLGSGGRDGRSGASDRVRSWADELSRARSDPNHPLHVFAAAACDRTALDAKSFATSVEALGSAGEAANGPEGGQVIVDFGTVDSLARFQDGFAFGLRPARPGDLRLKHGPGAVRLGLFDRAAAHRDPAFRGLTLAAGTERDHGRLGTWDRAGQTLRTPEFTVGSGRLWYLARGAGRAYASVNSHMLIAGPLHDKLLTEWTDGQKGWRWVRHDLTAYTGKRAHIEFCPSGPGDLAIATVIDSAREPQLPGPSQPLLRALRALAPGGVDSPEGMARAYQALASEAVRLMEGDAIAKADGAEVLARVADWLLGSPDLFGPSDNATCSAIRDEAELLRLAEESIAQRLAAPAPAAPAMLDGSGVNEHLLIRGSSRTPGPEVPRRFLEAIAGDAPLIDPSRDGPGSGRLALARQMPEPTNPFASRVIVNRVWHHLFGRGIVASVDNFGALGDTPTHPELLDHLADRFVRDGWSLKRLIRALVLTRAYRMSSRHDPRSEGLDPENRLLHRMPVRRLEAEPIRDAILAVSGRLDGRFFGPSVPVHLTPFMAGRGRPASSGPLDGDGRRSLYLAVRRNFLSPMMLAFDAPIPFTTIGRRNVSNVPAQALILMNDPFVIRQAGLWADRVLAGLGHGPAERVTSMFLAAFARSPDPDELAGALAFLESQGRELGLAPGAGRTDRRAWADLAHVLFNSKEFIYID
jgi:hypothetical protein